MANDHYENIRKALAMEPTAGPWSEYANRQWRPYIAGADGSLIAFIESDDAVEDANAAHIAACDPDTIRELLAERDALDDRCLMLHAAYNAEARKAERLEYQVEKISARAADLAAWLKSGNDMPADLPFVFRERWQKIAADIRALEAAIAAANGGGNG